MALYVRKKEWLMTARRSGGMSQAIAGFCWMEFSGRATALGKTTGSNML